MPFRTPINGETWLPKFFVDYFTAIRTPLGLPTELKIQGWPFVGRFIRPYLGFEATTFRFDGHPGTQIYSVSSNVSFDVDDDPEVREDDAAAQARREAVLLQETTVVSLVRAALALRPSETLEVVTTVKSLFDWAATDRVAPVGEDYCNIECFTVAAAGGSLTLSPGDKTRKRMTNYTCHLATNEFTPCGTR